MLTMPASSIGSSKAPAGDTRLPAASCSCAAALISGLRSSASATSPLSVPSAIELPPGGAQPVESAAWAVACEVNSNQHARETAHVVDRYHVEVEGVISVPFWFDGAHRFARSNHHQRTIR